MSSLDCSIKHLLESGLLLFKVFHCSIGTAYSREVFPDRSLGKPRCDYLFGIFIEKPL